VKTPSPRDRYMTLLFARTSRGPCRGEVWPVAQPHRMRVVSSAAFRRDGGGSPLVKKKTTPDMHGCMPGALSKREATVRGSMDSQHTSGARLVEGERESDWTSHYRDRIPIAPPTTVPFHHIHNTIQVSVEQELCGIHTRKSADTYAAFDHRFAQGHLMAWSDDGYCRPKFGSRELSGRFRVFKGRFAERH